jgi:hypothetical protein
MNSVKGLIPSAVEENFCPRVGVFSLHQFWCSENSMPVFLIAFRGDFLPVLFYMKRALFDCLVFLPSYGALSLLVSSL